MAPVQRKKKTTKQKLEEELHLLLEDAHRSMPGLADVGRDRSRRPVPDEVHVPPHLRPVFSEIYDDDAPEQDENTYEAESIEDERTVGGVREFLVKFKGYGHEDNEWIAEQDVDAPRLVAAFEERRRAAEDREVDRLDELFEALAHGPGSDDFGAPLVSAADVQLSAPSSPAPAPRADVFRMEPGLRRALEEVLAAPEEDARVAPMSPARALDSPEPRNEQVVFSQPASPAPPPSPPRQDPPAPPRAAREATPDAQQDERAARGNRHGRHESPSSSGGSSRRLPRLPHVPSRYDRRRRRWLLQDDLDDRWRLYGRAGQDRELFRFISREGARRLYPRVLRHFRVDEDALPKPVLKSLKDGVRRGFYALRL